MFGWWKKNEGFEWREYVRTTILLRRKRRQDRVAEAKATAVAGLKDAGRAGAKASASGLAVLMRALTKAASALGRHVAGGLAGIGRAPAHLGRWLVPAFNPLARAMADTSARGPILLIGGIGTAAAVFRWTTAGLDTETLIAACLGPAGIGLGLLPTLVAGTGSRPAWLAALSKRLPRLPAVSPAVGGGLIVVGLATLVGYAASRQLPPGTAGSLLSSLPLAAASKPIQGKASAVGGDMLRVGNVVVRLAGVESPEDDQRCGAAGRKGWRCGDAAQEALTRTVRGKLVSCTLSGSDESGRSLATCRAEGADIAANLVRQGHVFAQQGMFARYASDEIEARTAKAGIWRGETQRPADWRAKRWEEAKRAAPDGCPIKGAVGADGKIYILPWSRQYDRVRIRTGRGERWFCTEQDARAAGWRSADRS